MDFVRDDYKAAANFRKHGVSFSEAETVKRKLFLMTRSPSLRRIGSIPSKSRAK